MTALFLSRSVPRLWKYSLSDASPHVTSSQLDFCLKHRCRYIQTPFQTSGLLLMVTLRFRVFHEAYEPRFLRCMNTLVSWRYRMITSPSMSLSHVLCGLFIHLVLSRLGSRYAHMRKTENARATSPKRRKTCPWILVVSGISSSVLPRNLGNRNIKICHSCSRRLWDYQVLYCQTNPHDTICMSQSRLWLSMLVSSQLHPREISWCTRLYQVQFIMMQEHYLTDLTKDRKTYRYATKYHTSSRTVGAFALDKNLNLYWCGVGKYLTVVSMVSQWYPFLSREIKPLASLAVKLAQGMYSH